MEITTMTLGFVGLTAVAVIAIVLAWPRRPETTGSRTSTHWFGSDPVLFVGSDPLPADCGAGSDGGGGGCD